VPYFVANEAQARSIRVTRSGAAPASNRRGWRDSERARRCTRCVRRSVERPLTTRTPLTPTVSPSPSGRVRLQPSPGRGGSDRALYALVLAAPGVGLLSPSTRFNSERAHLAVLVDPDRGFRNRAPVFDSRQRDRRLACIVRGAGLPSPCPRPDGFRRRSTKPVV
jgi:hypothetical protein